MEWKGARIASLVHGIRTDSGAPTAYATGTNQATPAPHYRSRDENVQGGGCRHRSESAVLQHSAAREPLTPGPSLANPPGEGRIRSRSGSGSTSTPPPAPFAGGVDEPERGRGRAPTGARTPAPARRWWGRS